MTTSDAVRDLRQHYQARFQAYGDDPRSTQMSPEGQRFRFEKLLDVADLSGRTVLDVGAGLGELAPSLLRRYPTARYTGIDVVPEMVACAGAKHRSLEFRVHDLLAEPLADRFDYVLLSAVFNNAIPEPTAFLEGLVARAFAQCRLGIAFNFISRVVNHADPSMAYHDPARVLAFCIQHLTPRVRLEHHYERCDVAVFAYR